MRAPTTASTTHSAATSVHTIPDRISQAPPGPYALSGPSSMEYTANPAWTTPHRIATAKLRNLSTALALSKAVWNLSNYLSKNNPTVLQTRKSPGVGGSSRSPIATIADSSQLTACFCTWAIVPPAPLTVNVTSTIASVSRSIACPVRNNRSMLCFTDQHPNNPSLPLSNEEPVCPPAHYVATQIPRPGHKPSITDAHCSCNA